MVIVRAGPAEILRSSQKDDFVIKKLQKLIEDAFLGLAGPRQLILHKNIIQNIGQMVYYGTTTLNGLQTLGEEYTGILQVDKTFNSIPSLLSRVTMIILQCFGHRLAETFLNSLEKNITKSQEMRPEAKMFLFKWISIVKAFLPAVELLHKAIFYCHWGTYHLSKRFTGIQYILIRYWLRDRKSLFGFRILGGITLANFVLFSVQTLHDLWKRETDPSSRKEDLVPVAMFGSVSSKKCAMCLSPLQNPTATMCGHIFCWDCINEWVQSQEQCPNCRERVIQSRLIPLMNYL